MRRKIEGLELARFAFAAAVMVYHYLWYGPTAGQISGAPGPQFLIFGRFAVEAFFVISGYVIARSAASRQAADFSIARARRLWPALIACATITALVTLPHSSLWHWLRAVLFLPLIQSPEARYLVDPSYWSIVIEMRFYLGVAVLLLVWRRLPNLDLVAAAWLALSGAAILLPGLRAPTLSPYSAFFIFGLLMYSRESGSRLAPWLMPAAFALAGWQAFDDFARVDMLDGVRSPWWTGYAVAAVIFVATAAMRSGLPGPLGRVSARYLGPMTYPLYLVHQQAGYAVINRLEPALGHGGAVLVSIGLAFACAFAISQWLEPTAGPQLELRLREAMQWGRSLRQRRLQQAGL